MKIETKFNVGDEVYYVADNKAQVGLINTIRAWVDVENRIFIRYELYGIGRDYEQDELFENSAEIITYIFRDINK